MTMNWSARRLIATEVRLPEGVASSGTSGQILRAGLARFAEVGFYGASIRDIAAIAGVNSATLYAHYPSKEHILAALILHGHVELHRRLQEALVRAGVEPADQLAAVVRAHVSIHTDFPMLAVVTNTELHALSPELGLPAVTLREQSRQLLLQVLMNGAERGAFAIPDTVLTATAISAIGMRVATWFGPEVPYTADEIADTYVELALRIVGARVETPSTPATE
ncbi:TetR/AcrR family transcriptional regulator [Agromyces sp. NPDC058136]|uniref:TetR/AcrR family transcriptional regulator n=1 Tax=Agromyces sp. NPDC058136 TaxID=3346354 RepID=UPI0036D8CD74